eukprot:SAG31_NODE_6197_length_2127_cov_3.485700_1_plen_85_part_00
MPRAKRSASAAAEPEVEPQPDILVDEEDLDEEMVEALRELRCHHSDAAQSELDRVSKLPAAAMAQELRKIILALTPEQVRCHVL